MSDPSNGYEAAAEAFMSGRGMRSTIGVAHVREWSKALPVGASVLDLGCGSGSPISQALVDGGFVVSGVDASPSMIAAFRARFPDAQSECASVEVSRFFDATFDAVVAWGLIFLLSSGGQETVIHKVAKALKPGGKFLFTAPRQTCEWSDNLTGQKSRSLGSHAYRLLLEREGFVLTGEQDDEGDNHYYLAEKSG